MFALSKSSPIAAPLLRLAAIMLIAGLVVFGGGLLIRSGVFDSPPGAYEVREGDILLTDGAYGDALERFEAAITLAPDHYGAWMGKAIALTQSGRPDEALAAFSFVIDAIGRRLAGANIPGDVSRGGAGPGASAARATASGGADAVEDAPARAILAAAYADRGILFDRLGRWDEALADYRRALALDASVVSPPGIVARILYGNAHPSSVARRAEYLAHQLALPADDRVMRIPDIDARQRMHKP
ncbi:MAG: tetratricopeptide repeat protein [Rhodospirillales bacterium]|nr:tetratricopeptide repeat protein [Rhodospirillales bacterium]